jgi:hypothetical protein
VEKLHQLYFSDGKVVQELPHIGHIRAHILDQIANLRPGTEPSCSCPPASSFSLNSPVRCVALLVEILLKRN